MAKSPSMLASVDLGSNSFHMVIARPDGDELQVIDRIREPIQLATGLGPDGTLDDVSQERAIECLRRFGERLRALPSTQVRAVGTNTLRKARNSRAFINNARAALGHEIQVLPGREEARLIYLGVAHTIPDDAKRRLVVDIGGGSTECIIGERFEPRQTDSLHMGCVSYSGRFFSSGEITRKSFDRAKVAAELELQPIARRYRNIGWQVCIGASGTIRSVEGLARQFGSEGITRAALDEVEKQLLDTANVRRLATLPAVEPARAKVLPGGIAILSAVFDMLEVEQMTISSGALREGLLWDLMGRIHHEDVRSRTIESMSQRYSIDREHASRVERTAMALRQHVGESWGLATELAGELLSWAARLHEVGLALNYAGYHKHGEYLLKFSEMPGFAREEQEALAAIVRSHRRKLSPDIFAKLSDELRGLAKRLAVLLRIAVLLNRSRSDERLPAPVAEARHNRLRLRFAPGWLEARPLTTADLEEEADLLRKLDIELKIQVRSLESKER